MLVPLKWLKDYVDFSISPHELGEMLTMAGLELESVEYIGKELEKLVVAEILEISSHPNADRLKLCKVSDGSRNYNIVCGADNMKVGDKVVLAPPGTKLPSSAKFPTGIEIKKTKIRGEISEGMLCAEDELGLAKKSEGIMILPPSAPPGAKVIEVLNIEDIVFELGITPNRPDCLSIIGVAREVSAITGAPLKYPPVEVKEGKKPVEKMVTVRVEDPEGCPRYCCRIIEGIKVGSSPEWLKSRIEAAGIRSINNIVDITNFVLLEFGQPLHAFDLDLLPTKKIVVRKAREGEQITTLDGITRKLSEEELLICDSDTPIALAGIMGGKSSEVSESTTNILLESAYFNPVVVRRSSKKTGLKTESSYRFERGVDPQGVTKALDRASQIIAELCGGKIAKGKIDIRNADFTPSPIKVLSKSINNLLGTNISTQEMAEILRSLEFEVTEIDSNKITVIPPSFRIDIEREADIAEEIGRLFGYNNIQQKEPLVRMRTDATESKREVEQEIKNVSFASGFLECINYSFENPSLLSIFDQKKPLEIINPLTIEQSAMRTTLLVGLLRNVKLNLDRGESNILLFEIGKVFYPTEQGQLPKEITKVAAIATGKRQPEVWGNGEFDFFDLKNMATKILSLLSLEKNSSFEPKQYTFLHPGSSAAIVVDGKDCGMIGELHPDLYERFDIDKKTYLLELDVDLLLELHSSVKVRFQPLPKFPGIKRDISVVVSEDIPVDEIVKTIKKTSNLIEDVYVFDIYRGKTLGKGIKSVSVSMLLRTPNRTLTDKDANKVQEKVLKRLHSAIGAELRQN